MNKKLTYDEMNQIFNNATKLGLPQGAGTFGDLDKQLSEFDEDRKDPSIIFTMKPGPKIDSDELSIAMVGYYVTKEYGEWRFEEKS